MLAAKSLLDDYSGKTYLSHLKKRRAVIAATFASAQGGLRDFAMASLAENGPSAWGSLWKPSIASVWSWKSSGRI